MTGGQGSRTEFDDAPGIGHEMQCLYAWVAADDGTGEGIIGFLGPDGWMPMVCATPDAALRMQPLAQQTAAATGRASLLLRFDARNQVRVVTP